MKWLAYVLRISHSRGLAGRHLSVSKGQLLGTSDHSYQAMAVVLDKECCWWGYVYTILCCGIMYDEK